MKHHKTYLTLLLSLTLATSPFNPAVVASPALLLKRGQGVEVLGPPLEITEVDRQTIEKNLRSGLLEKPTS